MKEPYNPKLYQLYYIETANQKILELFFKNPDKEYSLSEIAKETKVAKANIGKILRNLEKNGLIKIIKLPNIWRIKANLESWNYIKSKIVYNLNFIYRSGLVEFLNDYYKNPKAIVLFGSFRKGEDITGSDIDIAIESDVNEVRSLRELYEFEKEINRNIQIHLFNKKNIDINLFNNIVNGIVLNGFLEVKNERRRY